MSLTQMGDDTSEDYFDVPEFLLKLREDMLWHAPAEVMDRFLEHASESLKAIEVANDVRQVVLEAWLLVDLVLRDFLLGGLDLHKIDQPAYDLRYELLPRRFEGLIRTIIQLRDVNATLPESAPSRTRMPPAFFFWLRRKDRDVLERFLELERAYYAEKYPETLTLCDSSSAVFTTQPRQPEGFRRVSTAWLKSAGQITESWAKRASQLNRARNLAAHSHDRTAIAAALGYAGQDALVLVRRYCITLVRELLGIVRLDSEAPDVNGSA